MLEGKMAKILGEGIFSAYRQNGILYLSAIGQKPTPQTKVTIDQLPFLIFPPRFALMFETGGISTPVVVPFDIERAFPGYPPSAKTVYVLDKNGMHGIDIIDIPATSTGIAIDDPTTATYVVYRLLTNTGQYLIAKSDAIVPAIYTKVFGPDTYAACQAYVAAHSAAPLPSIDLVPGTLTATINRQPGTENGSRFNVTVDAFVEVDWSVTLVSAVPQGINPLVKLLKFDIQLPTGPVHSNAIIRKTFSYQESPTQESYTNVTLENGSGSISATVGTIV
jgi:uncharacterized protein YbdZ (MbtH family)